MSSISAGILRPSTINNCPKLDTNPKSHSINLDQILEALPGTINKNLLCSNMIKFLISQMEKSKEYIRTYMKGSIDTQNIEKGQISKEKMEKVAEKCLVNVFDQIYKDIASSQEKALKDKERFEAIKQNCSSSARQSLEKYKHLLIPFISKSLLDYIKSDPEQIFMKAMQAKSSNIVVNKVPAPNLNEKEKLKQEIEEVRNKIFTDMCVQIATMIEIKTTISMYDTLLQSTLQNNKENIVR